MQTRFIDVGSEFGPRLANRDSTQGDGKFTALTFRREYLSELDNREFWAHAVDHFITLDFSKVSKIGPSFANEAFAYFTQYAKPDVILRVIRIQHATKVQKMIIEYELWSGYSGQ